MMKAKDIRENFLEFFESKGHEIVSSAPIVNKDDPSLMFTNAGMNQFKDYFLGNKTPDSLRVTDTQKCLRVSGKHNDLEEVGRDSYHHTMFEMLGNWSFGDYFKREAIAWGWELLIEEYGLDPDRMYATVFEGDQDDGLDEDYEAVECWKDWIPEDRILYFGKMENFWEMGDTGPCGPCSEIHYDLRPEEERRESSGKSLVNRDHPMVVELWNLVFIQYNRMENGRLKELPAKHVDTGMGLERLCMALQDKSSNYDTDLFTPLIRRVEQLTLKEYEGSYAPDTQKDIAFRVVVDHIRAVAFAIGDGALPSNTGAGYVIRRILRRAVRYYYSFLDRQSPLLHLLMPVLVEHFGGAFPEIKSQQEFITKVIEEEEKSFLRTLEGGLDRFEELELEEGVIDGDDAFELYDTYGFPIDLTRLIASERGWTVDEEGFNRALAEQRERSRRDARKSLGDWQQVRDQMDIRFMGYDQLEVRDAKVVKYRTIEVKDEEQYHLVLDKTPFYPEGGGQVGDTGRMEIGDQRIEVLDTIRENELIIHIVDQLPQDPEGSVRAVVDRDKRRLIRNNHSATHLLHAALREVLGEHVQQKGSLLNHTYLRFDFSHYQKVTDEELEEIEHLVNRKIRQNIPKQEARDIPIEDAKEAGALMLFGEKYGDKVRMITFDPDYSRELCGGCHVNATGEIGVFKIINETSVSAGVRRIEAVTADAAEDYIREEFDTLNRLESLLQNFKNPEHSLRQLMEENKQLKNEIDRLQSDKASQLKSRLKERFEEVDGVSFLAARVPIDDSKQRKTLAYELEKEHRPAIILVAFEGADKAQLMLTISKSLTEERDLHAGKIISKMAQQIGGGGGGQPFFASAGGSDPSGLDDLLDRAKEFVFQTPAEA